MLPGLPVPALVLQAGDPIPFGPPVWGGPQWVGIAVYLLIFLLFLLLLARFALRGEEAEGRGVVGEVSEQPEE